MEEILIYTYRFDLEKLSQAIENLWSKYIHIIENKGCTEDEVYRARAILYFLGYLYSENIGFRGYKKSII